MRIAPATSMKKAIPIVLLGLIASYIVFNVPGCEGGGAKRVNGEWVDYATLSRRSIEWPVTDAVVVVSKLRRTGSSGGSRSRSRTAFRIRYEFTLEGVQYAGDTVQFVAATQSRARTWARRYLKGKHINVSYDPVDPGLSVIIPGGQ